MVSTGKTTMLISTLLMMGSLHAFPISRLNKRATGDSEISPFEAYAKFTSVSGDIQSPISSPVRVPESDRELKYLENESQFDLIRKNPTARNVLDGLKDPVVAEQIKKSRIPALYMKFPDALKLAFLEEDLESISWLFDLPTLVDWNSKTARYGDGYLMSASGLVNVLKSVGSFKRFLEIESLSIAQFLVNSEDEIKTCNNPKLMTELVDQGWIWCSASKSIEGIKLLAGSASLVKITSASSITDSLKNTVELDSLSGFKAIVESPPVSTKLSSEQWLKVFKQVFKKPIGYKTFPKPSTIGRYILEDKSFPKRIPYKNIEKLLKSAADRNDYSVLNSMLGNEAALGVVRDNKYHGAVRESMSQKKGQDASLLYLRKSPALTKISDEQLGRLFVVSGEKQWKDSFERIFTDTNVLKRVPEIDLEMGLNAGLDSNYDAIIRRLLGPNNEWFIEKLSDEFIGRLFVSAAGNQDLVFVKTMLSDKKYSDRLKSQYIADAGIVTYQNEPKFGPVENKAVDLLKVIFTSDRVAMMTDVDLYNVFENAIRSENIEAAMVIVKSPDIMARMRTQDIQDGISVFSRLSVTIEVRKELERILDERIKHMPASVADRFANSLKEFGSRIKEYLPSAPKKIVGGNHQRLRI